MLFFVLTISVLLNLLCVWILLYKLVPSPSPRLFWFLPVLPRHFHTGCLHTTQRQHWREKKNYFLHCKRKAHKSNIDKSVNNTKETPEEKLFIHIIQIQQHKERQEKLFIHSICKQHKGKTRKQTLTQTNNTKKDRTKKKLFYTSILYRVFASNTKRDRKKTFYTEYSQRQEN